MQFTQRATAVAAIAGLLLCAATATRAQVNGDATIRASVLGQPLSISTSSQFAGAISSIRWANKEFINDWDHGRQLQLNSQFFNRFECYNPYEAGSIYDGKLATTSSRLLALTASGNTIDSTTQMAWYLRTRESLTPSDFCGDPAYWLPCPPYTGPLSNYRVHKTVTIGFAGIPNVIEYLTQLYIPEQIEKGINNVTAVMPYDFSSVWSYDVISKDYRNIRSLSGEDDRIKVVSTADGMYAMAFYAPELLQPYGDPGTANFWRVVPPDPSFWDPNNPSVPDPNFACVHVGSVNRYDSFNGPGYTNDRAYLVIGSLDQVRDGLASLHLQFRALDPDVYNWRDYLAINGLESALPTQEAAETDWINRGIAQGLTASKTFSASQYLELNPDIANVFGATNYPAAIAHYITTGRGEGRSTVAKPAAGMQHLLVFANSSVNASGQNVNGQLGNGTLAATSAPTHIFSLDNTVMEVAAGDYTSFAVKTDGSLWVWGSNQYGARGDGTSGDNTTSPVQVPIPNRVTTPTRLGKHAVAVGAGVYAVIDTEGQVWTWGVNWNGRLGDGTTISRLIPARVKKSSSPDDYLTGIVSVAAGGGTMAAIDADGTVWTWGAGSNGALGNGSTEDSPYPVQVMKVDDNNQVVPLVGISQVACGSSGFCIALARYGEVFGWGSNEFSQLGLPAGGALSIATPIEIGPRTSIDAIAAGTAHCIAHSQDGNVYGWGYNGRGQLGTGSTSVAQSPPVVMNSGPDGMNNISDLAAGANFSVMIRYSDRAVFVTGDNQSGQLGTLLPVETIAPELLATAFGGIARAESQR
jgi:alpha-tubulin suppressor-like RCC1 family protein